MKKKLGHYQIEAELGRGGMGVVYKAHEQSLNRFVALKVLADKVSNDPNLVARFKREAQSAARLNHPNITQVYFFGEDDGQHFFVMEYVEGESLSQMIRREKHLSPQKAAQILQQAASGLAVAHDQGVIHRDIKPGNLMIDKRGIVKIADFGIAHVHDPDQKLTATGQFLGTPGYLSPEVCLGKPMDQRSDIFSLGIVFYEMLTGSTPFVADSPLAMLREVVEAEAPDVRALNTAVDLNAHLLLNKMIEKQPENRFGDCHELADALQRYIQGKEVFPIISDQAPTVANTVSTSTEGDSMAATEILPRPEVESKHTLPAEPQKAPPPIPQPAVRQAVEEQQAHPPTVMAPAVPKAQKKKGPWIPLFIAAVLIGGLLLGWFLIGPEKDDDTSLISDTGTHGQTSPADPNGDDASRENEMGSQNSGTQGLAGTGPGTSENVPGSEMQTAGTQNAAYNPVGSQDVDSGSSGPLGETGDAHEVDSQDYSGNQGEPIGNSFAGDNRAEGMGVGTTAPVKKLTVKSKPNRPIDDAHGASSPLAAGNKSKKSPDNHVPEDVYHELPKDPKVLVVSSGDPMVGRGLESSLQQVLAEDRFAVLDKDLMPSLNSFFDRDSVDLVSLGTFANNHGADVLIVAEVAFLGERELNFSGRSMMAYKGLVTFKSYFPAGGRKLGLDQQRELEYTSLNASKKAEAAVLEVVDTLIEGLRN